MADTSSHAWVCTIHITSPEDAPEDDLWQEACRQLYNSFVDVVPAQEGDLKPLQRPAPPDSKALGILELFHQIVTYGVSIGAFASMYNLSKLWLEQRPRCEIELAFPDGSKLKVRNTSWQEAQRIIQEHQQMYGAEQSAHRPTAG